MKILEKASKKRLNVNCGEKEIKFVQVSIFNFLNRFNGQIICFRTSYEFVL